MAQQTSTVIPIDVFLKKRAASASLAEDAQTAKRSKPEPELDDWLYKLLPETWQPYLAGEWSKPYMAKLSAFLAQQYATQTVYPPKDEIFTALKLCQPTAVRVVILGQDVYHGPGQAHGLAFSVKPPTRPPPSLLNIFKELSSDIPEFTAPKLSDLTGWAEQGVLLFNSALTVVRGKPGAHAESGWHEFTNAVLQVVQQRSPHVVFLLWGAHARNTVPSVLKQHLRLTCAHPSPKSADYGFFGCKHFSQANAYVGQYGIEPVAWGRL